MNEIMKLSFKDKIKIVPYQTTYSALSGFASKSLSFTSDTLSFHYTLNDKESQIQNEDDYANAINSFNTEKKVLKIKVNQLPPIEEHKEQSTIIDIDNQVLKSEPLFKANSSMAITVEMNHKKKKDAKMLMNAYSVITESFTCIDCQRKFSNCQSFNQHCLKCKLIFKTKRKSFDLMKQRLKSIATSNQISFYHLLYLKGLEINEDGNIVTVFKSGKSKIEKGKGNGKGKGKEKGKGIGNGKISGKVPIVSLSAIEEKSKLKTYSWRKKSEIFRKRINIAKMLRNPSKSMIILNKQKLCNSISN